MPFQEEKDRKRVNVRLPRVQEKLLAAIGDYEQQHGTAFLVTKFLRCFSDNYYFACSVRQPGYF